MNQIFEALANMPPELLAPIILAAITSIVAPIIVIITLLVRWIIKRDERRDKEHQKQIDETREEAKRQRELELKERDAKIQMQLDESRLERESNKHEMELRIKQAESSAEQTSKILEIMQTQGDNITRLSNTHDAIEKRHSEQMEKAIEAITAMKDVLEVQSATHQSLREDVKGLGKLSNDFEAMRNGVTEELSKNRQRVDELFSRLEKALKDKSEKSDVEVLRNAIDDNKQLITKLGESLKEKLETKENQVVTNESNSTKETN